MTDKIWPSSILDVPFFEGADCGTGHCLVVAKVRERLLVSEQELHRSLMWKVLIL